MSRVAGETSQVVNNTVLFNASLTISRNAVYSPEPVLEGEADSAACAGLLAHECVIFVVVRLAAYALDQNTRNLVLVLSPQFEARVLAIALLVVGRRHDGCEDGYLCRGVKALAASY